MRQHLTYVGRLLDGGTTLNQHRRLLAAGAWLSVLAATCHIDLDQAEAGAARLRTAGHLAAQAEDREITAWCKETAAWQALTAGQYGRALELSRAARAVASLGSSIAIQAAAQEGRALARLGAGPQTRALLDTVGRLTATLPVPSNPEHHFRYDPAKAEACTATTLSWLGDPAAEPYARAVLSRMEHPDDGPPRPRRAAAARLDLALTLVTAGRPDEAADLTLAAIASGVLVPSNRWRAEEVISGLENRRDPQGRQLREALRDSHGR